MQIYEFKIVDSLSWQKNKKIKKNKIKTLKYWIFEVDSKLGRGDSIDSIGSKATL